MSRLKSAFSGCELVFASTEKHYHQHNPDEAFFYIPDASRDTKLRLIWQGICVLFMLLRVRPDIVVSTGATVGLWGLIFGKRLGARTIWMDSIANSECLSMCGERAKPFADLYLTQWSHLASKDGPEFAGAVI